MGLQARPTFIVAVEGERIISYCRECSGPSTARRRGQTPSLRHPATKRVLFGEAKGAVVDHGSGRITPGGTKLL